jgi:hypothetical protein
MGDWLRDHMDPKLRQLGRVAVLDMPAVDSATPMAQGVGARVGPRP